MASLSNYLENKVLDHVLQGTSYSKPATLYIALCTVSPGDTSTGATITEVSGTGYTRKAVVFATNAASGSISNTAEVDWGAAGSDWGTVQGIAILDSATVGAGNILVYGALAAAKTVNSGDTFKFPIGTVTVTLD